MLLPKIDDKRDLFDGKRGDCSSNLVRRFGKYLRRNELSPSVAADDVRCVSPASVSHRSRSVRTWFEKRSRHLSSGATVLNF
jgi:hypothetical protein